jgi:hypothetical protein
MAAATNNDDKERIDVSAVYPALGNAGYGVGQAQEKVSPMQQSASSAPANQQRIGAPPIRWGWWAAGLGFSATLWAGIALAFGALG